jgi:hypothetical protein
VCVRACVRAHGLHLACRILWEFAEIHSSRGLFLKSIIEPNPECSASPFVCACAVAMDEVFGVRETTCTEMGSTAVTASGQSVCA